MAWLHGEDTEVVSGLELALAPDPHGPDLLHLPLAGNVPATTWAAYRLTLRSGEREFVLEDPAGPAADAMIGRCLLALSPVDEVLALAQALEALLADPARKVARFEPSEPNFTLEVSRQALGYAVTCWVDAGNQRYAHATWDAMGTRFFAGEAAIASFASELRTERDTFDKSSGDPGTLAHGGGE